MEKPKTKLIDLSQPTDSNKPESAIVVSMRQSYQDTMELIPFLFTLTPNYLKYVWRGLTDGKLQWFINRPDFQTKYHTLESRRDLVAVRNGLDGELYVIGEDGQHYREQVIIRWYDYGANKKIKTTFKLNTIESFYEEDILNLALRDRVKKDFDPFWLILGHGRTPDNPQFIRVMKVSELDNSLFTLASSVESRNDLILHYGNTWVNVDYKTCFEGPGFVNDVTKELDKIRRKK